MDQTQVAARVEALLHVDTVPPLPAAAPVLPFPTSCGFAAVVVCTKDACVCVDPRMLPPPLPFETKCHVTVQFSKAAIDDPVVIVPQSFQCAGAVELGLAAALTMMLKHLQR